MILLTLSFLALTSVFVSREGGFSTFLSCFPKEKQVHGSESALYANLTKLSWVNNRAAPAAIVLAHTVADVSDAVRCARAANLRVCARSGGHSFVGKSLCSGVVIDVGPMRRVEVLARGIAEVQTGAIVGEVLWALHSKRRWFAGGVCPGTGVGGYVFGGGHNAFEGRLGIACDSLLEVTMVDRFGNVLVASKNSHKELFWGLCGAGGGQFGIVTSFKIQTVDSRPFDRAVVFRFNWKQKYSGMAVHKWMDYDENGGNVWFRMEQNENRKNQTGMNAFGACYDVSSVQECLTRLSKAEFFKVPGRTLKYIAKARNALDVHAFMGPEGGWGLHLAKDIRKAMLEQRYVEAGAGNERVTKSAFLKLGTKSRPTVDFWQKYSEYCADTGLKSIPWIMCQVNLFRNAILVPRDNAFAHRDVDLSQFFVVGGGNEKDKMKAYRWMENHLSNYTSGVYVNYEESELQDYASMYWGKSLDRLRRLKSRYDPEVFFANLQPIPQALASME